MKAKIYLETSVISYLATRPSRDLVVAANQRITHEWWQDHRSQYDLYVSQSVLREARKGDPRAAAKRIEIVENIPSLPIPKEAEDLANIYLHQKILPAKASEDALHIAIATVFGMDYLLTWNCKHIANAAIQKALALFSGEIGFELPVITTPQGLIGE